MKARHLALGAALLVAAGFAVFGDKTPESGVAEAVPRAAGGAASTAGRAAAPHAGAAALAGNGGASAHAGASAGGAEPAILRLLPRSELIGADAADADAVFGQHDWTPAPPPPAPPPPPPPPVAPPLPFVYIGKSVSAGVWEIYLARAEKTYIVRHPMVIDGIYRVDAIAPPTLTLTYLPLNQVQQLNIGVLD
jgi:hypothetical protein